ncbi:MAG TPA: hypothetical protein VF698_19880 [Thermoanaerobaculia bacterium]
MLTRVEVLRVSRNIKLPDLVNESGMSRQHLLRIRKGEIEPRRDRIAALVSAFRHLTLEDIQAEDIIELSREESGPWQRQRGHRITADVEAWKRERDAAARLLDLLRAEPVSAWLDMLLAQRCSDAVVRALIFEGRAIIDVQPVRAEALLDVAARLAEHVPDLRPAFRVTLIGRAWLELANARRQVGRYTDALAALDEAERRFEGEPYATKELGRAWLAHGTILLKIGDLVGADRHLRRAINVFAAVDDHRRLARVRMVQAGILFERNDFLAARDLWLSVAAALQAANERHSLGLVWLNLGWCEMKRDQPAEARRWLEQALDAFTRLRSEVDVLRVRWCRARLMAFFETRPRGVRALEIVRRAFEARSLFTDAGMVALDIVEALLLPPRQHKAAIAVCEHLPEFFQRAGAKGEAIRAVAYLHEAGDHGTLRIEDVKHVRRFLDHHRGERFLPPGHAA